MSPIRWAVFVSGEGSNLQNFLDLESFGLKRNEIVAVHADRGCRAIERARRSGKNILISSSKDPSYEEQLVDFLQKCKVDRIFLLGYMKILSGRFLSLWNKPIVNLHPSLLPKYPGLHAIERAFHAKEAELGVSLHEVTGRLDDGPLLRQLRFTRKGRESLAMVEEEVHCWERQIVRDYLFDLERTSDAV